MSAGRILCVTLMLGLLASASTASAAIEPWLKWQAEGDVDLDQQKLLPAGNCFREALRDIEHSSHTDDQLIECLEKLASTLTLEDKTEEAIRLYQRCLHLLERQYGNDSPKLIPTLFALGSIFESAGDHALAMDLYRKALAVSEKNYGRFSPAAAKSLHRLGRTNFALGRSDEAERNYKSSLAILVQQPSLAASDELESLLSDYQDLLRKKPSIDTTLISDFQSEILKGHAAPASSPVDLAPSAFQKQIAAHIEKDAPSPVNEQQQVLLRGYKEPFSGSVLEPAYGTMTDVLLNQKPFKEQEGHFERMIAIDINALGRNHPSVADDLMGLATLYLSEHRYADAKPLLVRALSIYESVYGANNLLVTNTRAALATVARGMGDAEEAKTLYGNIFDTAQMAIKPNALETARILNDLGHLYYRQGKLQDACTIYQWALSSTEGAAGNDSPLVAACLTDYANVLTALGRTIEANQAQARAVLILAKADRQN